MHVLGYEKYIWISEEKYNWISEEKYIWISEEKYIWISEEKSKSVLRRPCSLLIVFNFSKQPGGLCDFDSP